MKIVGKAGIETVADVVCDACTISTRVRTGANGYEFVTHLNWDATLPT